MGKNSAARTLAGSVIEKAEQGELRAAIFQPAMQAGIEQEHFPFAGTREAAQAMSGGASFARRAQSCRAQQAAKGFAAHG